MKVAPRQIQSFLSAIPTPIRATLLHGSDIGLIGERARKIAAHFSDDLDDVFSVTRFDGETLSSDPAALGDAAEALAMTATYRLVLVRGRGTEMLESCKLALTRNLENAFIIVEATETNTRHALVKLFETTDHAAAIGCYPDESRDIGALLVEVLAKDNISISDDARAAAILRLGSDRAATRREIEKLALLAGPDGSLSFEDVSINLGDSGTLNISDIAMAAADGRVDALERAIDKAWSEQQASVTVLRGSQIYFRQLLQAARAMRNGNSAQQAVKSLRPPVHFRLQDSLASQLRHWSPDALMDAVNRLQDAELTVKTGGASDTAICAQTLLGLCLRGRAFRG